MATVDVIVIGGGVCGTASAAFLAEAGLRVLLCERAAIGAGASGRNSGIVQHPFDPVLADLYRRTLREYRRLTDDPGSAFRLDREPAGLLYVGRDRAIAERTAADWAEAWPASAPEVLAGADLAQLEPALAPDLVACRLAVGFPVAPSAATEAFAAIARARGVEIAVGGDARPAVADGRIVGALLDGRVEPAGDVVVAAGPWTPEVIDPSGAWRPIRPSWGVVAGIALAAAPRHGLEAIDIHIEPATGASEPAGRPPSASGPPAAGAELAAAVEFSLVPAAGTSALGSTFLAAEPDPASYLDALRRVGSRYVPSVADAPLVGLRRCARPVSRDGRPLVGAASWAAGLFVIAGHGPWGISTGPGSARLLVDAMLGQAGGPIPGALAVDRFGPPPLTPAAAPTPG